MIKLARDGLNEMIVLSLVLGGATAALVLYWWPGAIVTGALWLGGLLFFRDPERRVPNDDALILAPADGEVTAVERLPENNALVTAGAQPGAPAGAPSHAVWQISIFLSVLDVHVNRMPYRARVLERQHRPGIYRNAMAPESALVNEAVTLTLEPLNGMPGPQIVRQIAGLIARRIVCRAEPEQKFAPGERFGLIKFGSRTDLTLPDLPELDMMVRVGDKVRGGLTVLARWTGIAGARQA
jgi:phosphatidylserine decarboxylase